MSTYRVEWPCCGSVTETQAWEPEQCPFCEPDTASRASCASCRWWAASGAGDVAPGLSAACRRHAPGLDGWPFTDATHVCGDWEPCP